jgi:hypothetical protein
MRASGMTRRELMLLGLGTVLSGCASVQRRAGGSTKRLIEFGWDEPDTAFMRRHIAEMEGTPFDGCVFHANYATPGSPGGSFLLEAWGTRAFSTADLGPALADLQATPFRRFTDNFLRFNTTPGDVDWFDDFSAVLANARLAAQVARQGKAKGILLDVEQYQAPLFTYGLQRDVRTTPWDAYAAQVRQRGREVMEAFQQGYPDLTVFLTFGYSGPWLESSSGVRPLAACEYGLLVPFLDGMVEAARGGTRLVDGYEPAYFHERDTTKFTAAYRTITEGLLPIVADPAAYRRRVSVGFGLWLDVDSRTRGWDGVDGGKNFYTPEAFEASVRAALEVAEEYVWIYTEAPRWWSEDGQPVDLPTGYAEALRRARQGLAP